MLERTITATDWTADRRASRILASFAKHPPRIEAIPSHQRWTRDDDGRYVGYRVECLEQLHGELTNDAFLAAEARGDMETARAIADQPCVQDAVGASLRIPTLKQINARAVELDPDLWGAALFADEVLS